MTGRELRKIRMSLGLRQTELAKIIDLTPGTLSRYETDTIPIPKMVELAMKTVKSQIEKEDEIAKNPVPPSPVIS